MTERKCVHCDADITLPHIRVWEENIRVSRMLTFCSIQCMVHHYTTVEGQPVAELVKDG